MNTTAPIKNETAEGDDIAASARQSASSPPFWRSILIGAVLVPISVYFGNYAYVVTQALLWGQTSLLRGPVFVLFLIALLNLLIRKVGKRAGLQASEMLVIYSMVAVATGVSGFGMIQFLINILPAGGYYATPVNQYERFLHWIPQWLVPHGHKVVTDFYIGHASWLRPDVLAAWALPVTAWSLFLVVMCWTTLCLSSIISRTWIEDERLAFPLVQLPLQMAQGASGFSKFFTSRAMWAGFIAAGLLESVNYINYLYPSMPQIQIKPYHLEPLFKTAPGSSIGVFTVAFYPFAIGIAFLLSLDVSFSCWFFYLCSKVENVVAAAIGQGSGGVAHGGYASPPFLYEQGVGAFVALGLLLLWRARRPILREIAAQRERKSGTSPTIGLMFQKPAIIGALAGMILLTAFSCVIGLPLWIALLFWIVYILILVVISRIFAEAGAGWVWGPGVAVHSAILDGIGTGQPQQTLVGFGLLNWFDSEFRDAPMPHQLEAIKMKEETHGSGKQMLSGLLIASVIGVVAAFASYLSMYYHYGAASANVRPALQGVGSNVLKGINTLILNPHGTDSGAIGGMAAGAVIVSALTFLRQWFPWWPLNPLGYALAGTMSMEYMWCPFLIGWAIKLVTLRYGGVKMFHNLLPFFLGLILGDYVVPMLWGIWGMAANTQVYMAFPH